MKLLGKSLSFTLKNASRVDKMDKEDLDREWTKAMALIDSIMEEAIDQGKVVEIKSSSQSINAKGKGWGDVEITFISGKLKAHIELDLKIKHRTHRTKKG